MQYPLATVLLATAATALSAGPLAAQSASKAPVTEAGPCTDADFWIGEWEVREAVDEIKIANVSVTTHAGHCVVLEEWTWTVPTDRSRGNSFCLAAYSDDKHDWQYDCGTDYGKRYNFSGGVLVGREWRFIDNSTPKGVVGNFSYTNLPDGRIREFGAESADGGKTWKTTVDVVWNRRK